jgi:hypothetical protein
VRTTVRSIPVVVVIVSMCRDGGGNSGHGVVVVSGGEDYPLSESGNTVMFVPSPLIIGQATSSSDIP